MLLEELDRLLGALPRGHARRAEVQVPCPDGTRSVPGTTMSSGRRPTLSVRPPRTLSMAKKPSRIDLLELDIDLRLTDLWREAGEITEWNLDVVAAFMRAAYGKGYCDALTEDAPGSALPRSRLPRSRGAGPRRRTTERLGARLRCGVPGKRSPARLVVALSVAAVLAVFLLYTSIAGGGTPSLQPSQLAATRARLARRDGRRDADRRRARGRPPLPAARRQGMTTRSASSTRARSRTCSRRAATSSSTGSCGTASSSPCRTRS